MRRHGALRRTFGDPVSTTLNVHTEMNERGLRTRTSSRRRDKQRSSARSNTAPKDGRATLRVCMSDAPSPRIPKDTNQPHAIHTRVRARVDQAADL